MKRGPFLALSADFCEDPDIVAVGERAAWLYLSMACDIRLHRGDGVIPAHRLPRLGVPQWQPRLDSLLRQKLVTAVEGGYLLPGYLKWNKSEHDYAKRAATGKSGACDRHHGGVKECHRDDCADARQWLKDHGYTNG